MCVCVCDPYLSSVVSNYIVCHFVRLSVFFCLSISPLLTVSSDVLAEDRCSFCFFSSSLVLDKTLTNATMTKTSIRKPDEGQSKWEGKWTCEQLRKQIPLGQVKRYQSCLGPACLTQLNWTYFPARGKISLRVV